MGLKTEVKGFCIV